MPPSEPVPLIDIANLRQALAGDARKAAGDALALRALALAHLREALTEGRKKARELLEADGLGTLCAVRLSQLQDELIAAICDFACENLTGAAPGAADGRGAKAMAVVAVGGYGRGTLAPGSDIDLLFVLPGRSTADRQVLVEFVLYLLWDLGLKVGHATRNLDECIRQSKADMTVRTSILEARFVWGDTELFASLEARFAREVVTGTASEFIAAKLAERDERHRRSGESRYLVEPNIKDGKGGLRDLHTLFWIGKYAYQVREPEELVKAGLFTRAEFRRFRRAEDFMWTVRCHMHFLAGKAEERLNFDVQRELAVRLGYATHAGLLDVERFMKHYFLMAKEVGDLTLIVCAELEERDAKQAAGIGGFFRSLRGRSRKIPGTLDFVNDKGRINVADAKAFERDPVNLLRMFKLAADNGLDFHPDALHLLTKSLSLVDRKLRGDEAANRLFLDILSAPSNPARLLRKMNECGLLGRLIPAFRKVVAMMQFNMYHHYTVDEHLIRSIDVLSKLVDGKLADEHPLSSEILPFIRDRVVLYVALFLHDIAKGRQEDHSIAGARIARHLCPRMGLDEAQTSLVEWLVREHLTMSMVAQSRDLSDAKTISDFAATVQSLERMRYLLVLTVCDIRAVGPGVWNGWKGQLLRTLYYETEPVLTGGFSQVDRRARVRAARNALAARLEGWSAADIEKYVELPYSAWFMATEPETQVRHMHFLRDADRAGRSLSTDVATRKFEAITEITVLAPDHPRLLSIIAGACAAAGANIVDAKIHTTSDGRALDSISINREFDTEEDELRRARRVGQMIEQVLSGQARLPDMIASRARSKRAPKAFRVQPSVKVNNELSENFTVIEIEGLDRPGLLSEITGALSDLNLNIGSAHVATFGEKVIDAFYVRDLVGHKITTPARETRIVNTLMAVLDRAPAEAGKRGKTT